MPNSSGDNRVKIRLLFFASLREQLGRSGEDVDLPSDVTTVAALRDHLVQRGGAYGKAFGGKALVRAAVNQDMVQPSAPIKPGDEVAFFPPVTGG
jgi:molybdopterin synthase sulfur carrier subunit